MSSYDLFKTLQKIGTSCAENNGYNSFRNIYNHVNSSVKNQSHDLLFVKRIYYRIVGIDYNSDNTQNSNDLRIKIHPSRFMSEIELTQFYVEVLSKVHYADYYGTPEIDNSNYGTSGIIYNVSDMFHALEKYMKDPEFTEAQKSISQEDLGTMDIFLDRSEHMKFDGVLSDIPVSPDYSD
jgi:hypothetical protein